MRPNWHLDVLVDESDPFGEEEDPADGERIDLRDIETLKVNLVGLLLDEARLEELGVTCAIKARVDCVCSACPLRHRKHAPHELCAVGVEQERVSMAIAVAHA